MKVQPRQANCTPAPLRGARCSPRPRGSEGDERFVRRPPERRVRRRPAAGGAPLLLWLGRATFRGGAAGRRV